MNINLFVKSYGSKSVTSPSARLSGYTLIDNKVTIGLTSRNPKSGFQRTSLLKFAAHKHIHEHCPKHLIEEVTFLKSIDYITWNARPCLLLIPKKSVLGLAAAHLYDACPETMSSTLALTDKFSRSAGPSPKTVISFLSPEDFFYYFDATGLPEHGAIFHFEADSAIETIQKYKKYSISTLTMSEFGVQLSMPVVTWGVSE